MSDNEAALAVRADTELFMPIMSIELAVERYSSIVHYVKELLKDGTDFGVIPGTPKATLLKPGAEKLCTLFGLSKRFVLVKDVENWGAQGDAFFYYLYRCALYRGNVLIAEADGSCNSHESKYRWRKGERVCPECGKATIIKGKAEYSGGWLCWRKVGKSDGCGEKFSDNDEKITGQNVERVANPDIADQVNTIQKMAQKRALIAATLLAVNASEFFTQDLEDIVDLPPVPTERPVNPAPAKAATGASKPAPAPNAGAIPALREQIKKAMQALNDAGDEPAWTVERTNQLSREHFGNKIAAKLNAEELGQLATMFSQRLESFRKTDDPRVPIIAQIKQEGFDGSEKRLEEYMAEAKLEALGSLSLDQLVTIRDETCTPF